MGAGLVMTRVLGEVSIFTDLERALMGATIVIEAIVEDLEAKKSLMKTLNDAVSEDVILATSTLRLDIAEIFSLVTKPERCLGLRFLFPVYSIPEVEVTASEVTSKDTMNTVTQWLERMGKTAFLRSGPEPLVLSEEEREARWRLRATSVKSNRGLGGRVVTHLPRLAHRGNFAPPQDDETKYTSQLLYITWI